MGFGNNLKNILDEKNKSVKWLAEEIGVPATTLYSAIKRDSLPQVSTMLNISKVLHIPMENLIADCEPDERESIENVLHLVFGINLTNSEPNWTIPAKYDARDALLTSQGYKLTADEDNGSIYLEGHGKIYELTLANLDELESSTMDYFNYKLQSILSRARVVK